MWALLEVGIVIVLVLWLIWFIKPPKRSIPPKSERRERSPKSGN